MQREIPLQGKNSVVPQQAQANELQNKPRFDRFFLEKAVEVARSLNGQIEPEKRGVLSELGKLESAVHNPDSVASRAPIEYNLGLLNATRRLQISLRAATVDFPRDPSTAESMVREWVFFYPISSLITNAGAYNYFAAHQAGDMQEASKEKEAFLKSAEAIRAFFRELDSLSKGSAEFIERLLDYPSRLLEGNGKPN